MGWEKNRNGQAKKRRAERFRIVTDYKLSRGCQVCGYNKCSQALQFHHVTQDNKYRNINNMVRNNSMDRIFNEINKCIIVCANCHAEIHANRLNDNTLPSNTNQIELI